MSQTNNIILIFFFLFTGGLVSGQANKITESLKKVEEDEVFKVVESFPFFPGCDNNDCSTEKILEFIDAHIMYPEEAYRKKVEGKVYLQFIVEKDGSIRHENTKIVRDIGSGCGEAAMEIAKKMSEIPEKWTPAFNRNEPVRVLYTLPIIFEL